MTLEYIPAFIRSYRHANGESLQALADRSGVSRSMIAQIESGQTSPTIAVLGKLANAMNIRLGDLVEPPAGDQTFHISTPLRNNIVSKRGSPFVCHQLVTRAGKFPADVYYFYFREYGKTAFSANVSGTVKSLWLEQGSLNLHYANGTATVKSGELVTFNASSPHRFECRHGKLPKGVFFVGYLTS